MVEVRGVVREVVAHELHDTERERCYVYQRRVHREIPVLALDPAAALYTLRAPSAYKIVRNVCM